MRVADVAPPIWRSVYAEWWKVHQSPYLHDTAKERLALYLTPEQLEDYQQYGAIVFESEEGEALLLHVIGGPRTNGHGCIRVYHAVAVGHHATSLIAMKLLYQAAEAGARSIEGREGCKYPP